MLKSFAGGAEHIILATGATDFRKQITMVEEFINVDTQIAKQVSIFLEKGATVDDL